MNIQKSFQKSAPPEMIDKDKATAYFNAVYERTIKKMSRYVISKCDAFLDREDILQNIYAKFYKYIIKKGWHGIKNEEAFLVNIAKFELGDYFKKQQNTVPVTSFADYTEEQMNEIEKEMSRVSETSGSLEDVLCNTVVAKQIFDDIAKGDPEVGKIFYLHFAEGRKIEEVAEVLELSVSCVKNKLYRTIERQKKKFVI